MTKKKEENILITGASSEIGQEIIREISSRDNLILAHFYRGEDKIKNLKKLLKNRIFPIKADLTNEAEVAGLISTVKEKCGVPVKIVHLPSFKLNYLRFPETQWSNFQADLDLQLKSAVLILKEFLPLMAKENYGRVVFMLSSCTEGMPPKFLTYYTTVKYALLGLMKSLAVEYAPRGVNINAISPSMVETQLLSNVPAKIIELNAEVTPYGRNTTTKDIAPLVKFLLSKDSDYITGANISVAGGSTF